MIPIVLCSIIALAIIVERLFSLRDSKIIPASFVGEARRLVTSGKVDELLDLSRRTHAPVAAVVEAAIVSQSLPGASFKEAVEAVGKEQSEQLTRFLGVLATIASIAPLLGLLGTVTGMIRVFNIISTKGVTNPSDLAGGISEALLTTAAGLVVAIPTLIAYNYFFKLTNRYILRMEQICLGLVSKLSRSVQPAGGASRKGAVEIDDWIKIDGS